MQTSLAETTDPAKRLEILTQLVDSTASSDLPSAKQFATQALQVAEDSGQEALLASAQLLAGRTWIALTSYDSANLFLAAAQSYFAAQNLPVPLGETHFYQGKIAANKREFSKAMQAFQAALEPWETTGHQLGIARAYDGISDLYSMQGDYEDAIEYGNRAVAILEKLDHPLPQANVHVNLAYSYLFQGDYDESLRQADRALVLVQAAGSPLLDLASVYNTRGNILKNMDRYDEAMKDYLAFLEISKKTGSQRANMVAKGNIGHTLKLKGDCGQALPYFLEVIEPIKKTGDTRNLWEVYMHTSECYAALGDFKNANRYTWLYAEQTEQDYEEEITQLKGELAQKYEAGRQGATIVLQQERIQEQATRQWLIGGIAGLLALAGLSLFWGFRQKQKSNAALEKANSELAKKNAENELLLKEIHHRVKNNLQTISSLLNLQSASITDASALAAVQESQSRVRSMALIHQKLYQGEKLAAVEMKDYFKTMGEAMLETFGRKAEKVELDVQMPELELDVDTAIPLGLIANELLTNSLKYAFPGERDGKIEVSLTAEGDNGLCFKIADNGVGISSGKQDGSFGPGTGFGGRLVQLLTMQLGGKMEQQGEGGTATVIRFKSLAKAA